MDTPPVCRTHNEADKTPSGSISEPSGDKLSWKRQVRHFTWAFFTPTMATGRISNVIYNNSTSTLNMPFHYRSSAVDSKIVPYRFRGLDSIGIIFFLANIAFYIAIWGLLLTRFYLFPYTFEAFRLHPTESLFAPASVVPFGTTLIYISQYRTDNTGPWLTNIVLILF